MEVTVEQKILHSNQEAVLRAAKRFNVLKCGRRWGKTEFAIDLASNALIDGEKVGFFAPTYKDVHETWGALKYALTDVTRARDEQVKQITTVTGGSMDVWSMDNPDSGRGRGYHLVIIDECEKAPKFREAWTQTIRATLTDYQGRAWFLSTPKFGKTYFKELFLKAQQLPDWAAFKFTSYDNPLLDKREIDAARDLLDDMVFACEYLADDVDLSLNPFAYNFDRARHVSKTTLELNPMGVLYLSFDFNVDPITCLAAQWDEIGKPRILKEFRLSNSDIYALCERIIVAYPNSIFQITGDATGRARSAITSGNVNYYSVIKQLLRVPENAFKQPSVNPSVADTRVLMNSIMQKGDFLIDPSCTYFIEDLIFCETDERGDIDKAKDKHRSHLLDCGRYLLATFHRAFLKV